MTQTFYAQLDTHLMKYGRQLDFIVAQSAHDVISLASRTSAGLSRGGSVRKGFVPRHMGFLAASLRSRLYGSSSMTSTGENAYVMVVARMDAGDNVDFEWTAKYAAAQHYGYINSAGRRVGGWMWVDNAAGKWQGIVTKNVIRSKSKR